MNIPPREREARNRHPALTLWLTGLSGSGKSTLARLVEEELLFAGVQAAVLDGDELRKGLNRDLGFSREDRRENIRRAAETALLLNRAGVVAITAFISPYREDREAARAIFAPGRFLEVFLDCPLEVCEARDGKGLYRKARAGELPGFTGIDDPYQPPLAPDLALNTSAEPPTASAGRILSFLAGKGVGPARGA